MANRRKKLLTIFLFSKYHFQSVHNSNNLLFHTESQARWGFLIHSTRQTKTCMCRLASINIVPEHLGVVITLPILGNYYQEEQNWIVQLCVKVSGKTRKSRFICFPRMAVFPSDFLPMHFFSECIMVTGLNHKLKKSPLGHFYLVPKNATW